jgi:hypothetical protein
MCIVDTAINKGCCLYKSASFKSEELQSNDFLQMWCGQSAPLCTALPARELTGKLMVGTLSLLENKTDKIE